MKRRVRAKRRNRMLRADKRIEKVQLRHMGKDVFSEPSVKRLMIKLERAIDLLPPFHKPHRKHG